MPQWISDIQNPPLQGTDLVTSIMVMVARLEGAGVHTFYKSRTDKAFLIKSKVRRKLLEEGFTLKQVGAVEGEITGKNTHHATIIHSRDTDLSYLEDKFSDLNEKLEKEIEEL